MCQYSLYTSLLHSRLCNFSGLKQDYLEHALLKYLSA